jgi:hypothetical protein
MRTTIDLEPDVFLQARQIAQAERTSIGKTISRLLRERFQSPPPLLNQAGQVLTPDGDGFTLRNGFAVLPSGGRKITLDSVQRIMDEEGI